LSKGRFRPGHAEDEHYFVKGKNTKLSIIKCPLLAILVWSQPMG
jgi:hypothetical protein